VADAAKRGRRREPWPTPRSVTDAAKRDRRRKAWPTPRTVAAEAMRGDPHEAWFPMSLYRSTLTIATQGRGTYDLTAHIQRIVAESGVREGLCHLFVHHTSASLIVCENADPQVRRDLEAFFARLVCDGDGIFGHDEEGPDDMPAHVRSVVTGVSLTLPVEKGRCDLGTWQGVYLYEHRRAPNARRVTVTVT
jgi:secondary thiamine-phosphate synthase enzyme